MIVLDASAAIDLVMGLAGAPRIRAMIAQAGADVHAPHLIDVEVTHALRRKAALGVDPQTCRQALLFWLAFPVTRHPHAVLAVRAWDLRANFSAYDAVYLALAEILSATLVTCDRALASKLHSAAVEVV